MFVIKKLLDPSGPQWIALGAGISGLSTYVLLAAVAAGVGATRFDTFSLYWAILIVVSVGGYLPLEQIVARHSAADTPVADLRRWAARWGLATAVLGVIALAVIAVADRSHGHLSPWLVLLFALNLVAVTVQATLRGLAAGNHRLNAYAGIVGCDSIVRTGLCAVLAVLHVHAIEAYVLAIALGASSSVAVGALMLRGRLEEARPVAGVARHLSGEAWSLAPAMVSMQLLLNSSIFIAFLDHSKGASAGAVLAIASLVRTAVFVTQAAQAAYVGRIAALVHRGSALAARAMLVVFSLAVVLAACTVAGSWALGPWLVRLLYGADYVVTHGQALVVALGIGLFVVATVANDLSVARGMHRNAGLYWILGVLAAVVSAPLLPAGDARIFVPIMIGSVLALLLTVLRPRRIARS